MLFCNFRLQSYCLFLKYARNKHFITKKVQNQCTKYKTANNNIDSIPVQSIEDFVTCV